MAPLFRRSRIQTVWAAAHAVKNIWSHLDFLTFSQFWFRCSFERVCFVLSVGTIQSPVYDFINTWLPACKILALLICWNEHSSMIQVFSSVICYELPHVSLPAHILTVRNPFKSVLMGFYSHKQRGYGDITVSLLAGWSHSSVQTEIFSNYPVDSHEILTFPFLQLFFLASADGHFWFLVLTANS